MSISNASSNSAEVLPQQPSVLECAPTISAQGVPRPTYEGNGATIYREDALVVLRSLSPDSIDAVICDPPYAIKTPRDPLQPYRRTARGESRGVVGFEDRRGGVK